MITGTWKGKINRQKVEVKVVLQGDSLAGTSYYYESPDHFRRYSIKGYFDPETNEAVWWDDRLIGEKAGRLNTRTPGKMALLSRADFNCPGGARMMLDGKSVVHDEEGEPAGEVHLDKTDRHLFNDEWDYVIDNYTSGVRYPAENEEVMPVAPVPVATTRAIPTPAPVATTRPAPKPAPPAGYTATIEDKFSTRRKKFVRDIPITGDSIELRFYDNAEIDGDSISLFLNDKLIFTHIRLLAYAYTIRLATRDLADSNELTMVAENLGSIPPNTSLMVAVMGELRYEARLESTEGSSAMIRLVKTGEMKKE